MESWISQALAQWKQEEIELNQGVDLAEIENVETQIGYKFPPILKHYMQ